jgi:hypothetical protein
MGVKQIIDKNVIPGNSYTVIVDGNVEILFTEFGSIEETMQIIELPDGTQASGGRTEGGIETTGMIPAHDTDAIAFMDAWWEACKEPVQPSAYKALTVIGTSVDGNVTRTDICTGVFLKGRTSPEYNLEDGGTNMTTIEYTFSIDDVEHS